MKVLSIGNSFSQDAHRWLHSVSNTGSCVVNTFNLFIGGCTLETHYDNILGNKVSYSLEGNNIEYIKDTSVNEIIENETFDVVTIQQASGFSGIPQSYFPYLERIVEFIREKQPEAKIFFHKTWSYETDSTHGHFAFYNNNQSEMNRRINDCSEMVKKVANIEIIPSGDFIQYLRDNTKEFNCKNGGLSLNRDGFHLSLDYGRFAVSALWYRFLTGETVNTKAFKAENPDFDINLLDVIVNALNEFMKQ